MDSEYQFLSSTEWWISVVIAGVAINIASAYLKTTLDGRLSRVSNWWKQRSGKRKSEKAEYISRLQNEARFFELNSLRAINAVRWSILWILLGVMGFLAAQSMSHEFAAVVMGVSALAFIRGLQHVFRANQFFSYAEESVSEDEDNT